MYSKTLLIGNDINNLNNNYKWKDLIKDIIIFYRLNDLINDYSLENKPFPLLYEEIFLTANRKNNNKKNELALKVFIAQKVKQLAPNEIHYSINQMNIKNILTTNYDVTLEYISQLENKGKIKERIYSIFRFYENNGKKYWHIHGSVNSPASINLGYEHYSGQLQQMRNYVVSGTNYKSKLISKEPLIKRLNDNEIFFDSWIDFFFKTDVHIFGLSLDFVEIDLWWLLTYRARLIFYFGKNIKNQIFYYIPKKYTEKSKPKLEMLQANGIICKIIDESDDLKYYKKVLEKIKNA